MLVTDTAIYDDVICGVIDQLSKSNNFTLFVAMTPDGNITVDKSSDFPDYIIHAFKVTNDGIEDVKIKNGALA